MNDVNPTSIFYITVEMFPSWFWLLVVVGILLLYGVVSGFRLLRRRGLSAGGPLLAGLLAGLVATVLATWLLPYGTHAELSAFRFAIDFVALVFMALLAGLGVFALIFSIMARRRVGAQVK